MSIDPLSAALLERVLLACLQRGVDQTELARRLETGQSTTQPWFKRTKVPGGTYLVRLPAALGISGHWLLTGEGSMEPPTVPAHDERLYWEGVRVGALKAREAMQRTLDGILPAAQSEEELSLQALRAAQAAGAGPRPRRPAPHAPGRAAG